MLGYFHPVADALLQRGKVEWPRNAVEGADLECLTEPFLARVRAHDDDARATDDAVSIQKSEHADPIEPRHVDVQEHDLRSESRIRAAECHRCGVTVFEPSRPIAQCLHCINNLCRVSI